MNKDKINSKINQACNTKKSHIRRKRRETAFNLCSHKADTVKIKEYLARSAARKTRLAVKILDLFMKFSKAGLPNFMTIDYLAERFNVRRESISRVTSQMAEMGLITKKQQKFNGSNIYELNPVFNQSWFQREIYQFFPFLKVLAFNLLLLSSSVEASFIPLALFKVASVNLRKLGSLYNNLNVSTNSLVTDLCNKFKTNPTKENTNISSHDKAYDLPPTQVWKTEKRHTQQNEMVVKEEQIQTLGDLFREMLSERQ